MIHNGKVYRNLEGQVEYLTEYLQSNAVAAELGIKVVGEAENVSDIPEGEYNYGDAYMIGTEAPYEMYIWTRASGNHPEDFWFNVGHFPMPGPQGETGIGLNDVTGKTVSNWSDITVFFRQDTDDFVLQLVGTEADTLDDSNTVETPITLNIPFNTDGQVEITHYNIDGEKGIQFALDENLNNTYLKKLSGDLQAVPNGQPLVYGGERASGTKMASLCLLPIEFDQNNVVMFPSTGDNLDNNTITNTSYSRWNTVLGKANKLSGGASIHNANTENLVFGGKNNIHDGVQDSSTFGYRNEIYANQAFTAGYKNTNKGSESIVIGNQNTLNGTISIDTTGPDYDGASSNTKQCAVFGNKNTLGTTNQQMLVAGDNNTIGNNCKWGVIAGSHHNIGKDNFCVNAFDYGNTTERYVEDSTMIGYYNHIYGGPDGSNKVYAANMIGHDNNNLDGNGSATSDIVLLGAGLKPSKQNCTIIGKFNSPTVYDVFEIGNGSADDNRSNIFTIANDPLDGPVLTLGTVSLTAAQLTALKALI